MLPSVKPVQSTLNQVNKGTRTADTVWSLLPLAIQLSGTCGTVMLVQELEKGAVRTSVTPRSRFEAGQKDLLCDAAIL